MPYFSSVFRYEDAYKTIHNRFISYGRHKGNEFHYNDTLNVLSVSYFGELNINYKTHIYGCLPLDGQCFLSPVSAEDEHPLTVVHYHCNPNQSSSFIRAQSLVVDQPLQIWVESSCACPNACAMGDLGLGTIFLIILAVSAAAYFILGKVLPHT